RHDVLDPLRHPGGGPPPADPRAGRPAGRRRRGDRVPRLPGGPRRQRPGPAGVRPAHGGPVTAEPLRTSDGTALRVETQPSLPGLGGLYARGAAASGRIAAGRALPALPVIGAGRSASDTEHDGGPLTLPDVA